MESTLSTVLAGLRSCITDGAVDPTAPVPGEASEGVPIVLAGVNGEDRGVIGIVDASALPLVPPAIAPVPATAEGPGDGGDACVATWEERDWIVPGWTRTPGCEVDACCCREMASRRAVSPFCESTMVVTQLVSGSGGSRTRVMMPGTESLKYRLTNELIRLDLPTLSALIRTDNRKRNNESETLIGADITSFSNCKSYLPQRTVPKD
jgi:hypothetical protein